MSAEATAAYFEEVLRRAEYSPEHLGLLRYHTYVIHELRVVFVATAKCACTLIKLLAERLYGLEPRGSSGSDIVAGVLAPRRAVELVDPIHVRHAEPPSLVDLDRARLDDVLKNYTIVTTVRNPFARAVSAFVEKVICSYPVYSGAFDLLSQTSFAIESFRFKDFLRILHAKTAAGDAQSIDPHWQPLVYSGFHEVLPYTHVLRCENLKNELSALLEQLGPVAMDRGGDLLSVRPNELPKFDWSSFYDDEAIDLARFIYRVDFERFGYDSALSASSRPDAYQSVYEWAKYVRGRNHVIAILRDYMVQHSALHAAEQAI